MPFKSSGELTVSRIGVLAGAPKIEASLRGARGWRREGRTNDDD